MKKPQTNDHQFFEWSFQPAFTKPKKDPQLSQEQQNQEDMIRSLQNVFCKGRYRTWHLSQGNRT